MKTNEFEHNYQTKEEYSFSEIIQKYFSSKIIKTMPSLGSGDLELHCYNCGFEISESFSFCPNCGKTFSEIGDRMSEERVRKVIFEIMRG